MLVTFTSSTAGELIMFATHAHMIFDVLQKRCTARGVFTCEQLPDAMLRLQQAIDEEHLQNQLNKNEQKDGEARSQDDPQEPESMDNQNVVSLSQRAMPLLDLMRWTEREKGYILWEASCDF